MMAGLSQRLHSLIHDLESYTLHSGTQRVIGYLLRAETDADVADSPAQFKLPAGKNIIASRLNLTPEHFSRILHELTASGLILVDGRTVIICDMEKLRTFEG
jgi:CRP-like cAMP-binding protein